MFQELLGNLKENSRIVVNNKEYEILSKTHYTTDNPEDYYVKCVLSDHNVLVVIPDELVYIGYIIDSNLYTIDDNNVLHFDGREFEYVTEGHQVVKSVEFGSDDIVEKGCNYQDYQTNDEKYIMSLAILEENNERADILGTVIDVEDIILK